MSNLAVVEFEKRFCFQNSSHGSYGFRGSLGFQHERLRRPLKTTFDMTTLIFSSGGCPSYPFYPLKRVPSYPFLAENPSSEGATKDHLSSKPPQA